MIQDFATETLGLTLLGVIESPLLGPPVQGVLIALRNVKPHIVKTVGVAVHAGKPNRVIACSNCSPSRGE